MNKNIKSEHKKNKEMMNKQLYKLLKKQKKEEDKERINFIDKLSDTIKIPKDVLIGAPIITLIGKQEVCIENYKGITLYTPSQIKVLTKMGSLQVDGKKLEITYFTNDEMKINGTIHNISYVGEK